MRFYLNQDEYIDTSKPIDISIEMTNIVHHTDGNYLCHKKTNRI